MRKRSCNRLFDNIFWYTVYLFPLILYVCMIIGASGNQGLTYENLFTFNGLPYDFTMFMEFNFVALVNPIYMVFQDLFSDGSIIGFTLFDNYAIMAYLAYFVSVYIMHLMVDFILFIPRLCHKWMKAFTQGDD